MNLTLPATNQHRQTLVIGSLLVLVTLALYWPATTHSFILLDDPLYVSENPHVTGGLTPADVTWAFTSGYAANWHPLTWISHQLDCTMFGLFPGGHHLTSLLLHALNTLLLFLALKRLTKSIWPSAVVAAFFGWHPLHVESVAWVAERKDVLSTLFLMLTLLAYAKYAETKTSKVQDAKSKLWYGAAFFCFVLGLMSKPMLVTLPFVLLLLDYWPLKRSAECGVRSAHLKNGNAGSDQGSNTAAWLRLFVEKIPFFAAALVACVVTVMVQHAGGAVRSVAEVSYGSRLLNVVMAYARYAGRTFWPLNLCVYYLLPEVAPAGPAMAAAVALALVSWRVFRWRVARPWLMVGWFWFLGTLVPVIGFVQVGSQAMADRYTYIPLIGLFIALVWGVEQQLGNGRVARTFGGALALALLATCLVLTRNQLGFWRDDVSLWQRAASVTRNNYFAEYELGTALADAGRTAEAITHHEAALNINPNYEPAHYHLGMELEAAGRLDEAASQFLAALARDPTSEQLHNDLGVVRAQQGRLDEAIAEFKRAIELNPAFSSAYLNYGNALGRRGEIGAALANYRKARELDPGSPEVLDRMALLLATASDARFRDPSEAVKLAENASQLARGQSAKYLSTLATAYAAAGDFPKAATAAEAALARAQEQKLSDMSKSLEQDLAAYRRGQVPVK
jgi:tetratricopeptide (TPR) repeat protein